MNRFNRVLLNQYRLSKINENTNLISYMDEADIKIWYFLITGLDDPYKDGEYIFKLTAPASFPQDPPSFEFCTPNGVYELGGKICISVGEYHKNDKPGSTGSYGWRPSLGMMGFAREVLNGLSNYDFLDHGIRIISTTIEQKNSLAKKSKNYNLEYNYEIYMKLISFMKSADGEVFEEATEEATKELNTTTEEAITELNITTEEPTEEATKELNTTTEATEEATKEAITEATKEATKEAITEATKEATTEEPTEEATTELKVLLYNNEEEENNEEENNEEDETDTDGEDENENIEDFLKKIIDSSNSDDEEDDLNNLLANL